MDGEAWNALRERDPGLVAQVQQDLRDVASGRRTWAELLGVRDEKMIGLGKRAAAAMDVRKHAEAEEMFSALTRLDPYVPWFWMALGDARARGGHTTAAERLDHGRSTAHPALRHRGPHGTGSTVVAPCGRGSPQAGRRSSRKGGRIGPAGRPGRRPGRGRGARLPQERPGLQACADGGPRGPTGHGRGGAAAGWHGCWAR